MRKTYITFGNGDRHQINGQTIDRDCIVELRCATYQIGERMARELFGDKFATVEPGNEFDLNIMKHFKNGIVKL